MTDEELRQQAWNFFQMQAGQRLTTFNFYIAISSLLIAGLVATLKSDIDVPYLGLAFGLLLILFSFIFWKLDQRNGDLIKGAEAALKYFEKKAPLADDSGAPHVAKRFSREEYDTGIKKGSNSWCFWRNHYSYSQCFRLVFVIFGCCGFAGLCISIAMIAWK
jgi:hypothetical protein